MRDSRREVDSATTPLILILFTLMSSVGGKEKNCIETLASHMFPACKYLIEIDMGGAREQSSGVIQRLNTV